MKKIIIAYIIVSSFTPYYAYGLYTGDKQIKSSENQCTVEKKDIYKIIY